MYPTSYKLLLVDDEPDILEFLQYNLTKEGYQVFLANNGTQAIEVARKVLPHLILLDVMMEEKDGVETCAELREIPELSQCIIMFLTARSEDYTQIACFEAGADGYITKPIKPKILLCRIAVLLKRHIFSSCIVNELEGRQNKVFTGDLVIDRERHLVIKEKEEMNLPRKEFELLYLLCSKPNKVFTRVDICHSIWGGDVIVGLRTIDVHIRKLRRKIGDNYITTVKGVGYKFVS